ncbi:MAG: serine hydrolase [Candidatus Aminicenantes bacterium]|nr:MAG: serine hydrolase [Candidatus Aminicenantes bacterium]
MNNQKFLLVNLPGMLMFIFIAWMSLFPFVSLAYPVSPAQENTGGELASNIPVYDEIEGIVQRSMADGKIPGLTLVMIKGDEPVYIKGFGYADKEKEAAVTPDTLFELGSCSKAFTALAAVQLEEKGLIDFDDPVSKYFPGFFVRHKEQQHQVTIKQLLHHTSGIPWKTLALIPMGDEQDALEQTVRNLEGIEVNTPPGESYQYASANYALVGAIIEKASGMSYDKYMEKNIFRPLLLEDTRIGVDQMHPPENMAVGYKIGFFAARPYEAPPYRGNHPAGYVVSNGKDITRWLKLQMGIINTPLSSLIRSTHVPDLSVRPDQQSMTSYARGWYVNQYGRGRIFHSGLNPNFTTYIAFNAEDKTGVALLANSNSVYTVFLGNAIMNRLYGQEISFDFAPQNSLDKVSSVVSMILGGFVLLISLYILWMIVEVILGKRKFEGINWKKILKILGLPLLMSPFLLGAYLVPRTISDVTWDMALVWGPKSLTTAVLLVLSAFALGYFSYIFSIIFVQQNKYIRSLPMILILSFATGGANATVIFLITSSLYANFRLEYVLYYFGLAMIMYIGGRKFVQTRLMKLTHMIVYDMRIKLLDKIFFTSYERFELLERGRIFTTLNNDTGAIGGSAGLFVGLISSIITTVGVFIYLATIAFWATMVTVSVISVIATMYYIVSRKARKWFEEARDTQNVYMNLLNGLVRGFKELSIHFQKRTEYKDDLEKTCYKYRAKLIQAAVKFINSFLIGESMLILVLGAVGFAVPRLFPEIRSITLMSFIIALLYLIGPINGILGAIPALIQLRVAWGRVRGFIKAVPANMDPEDVGKPLTVTKTQVESINAAGVMFQYKKPEKEKEWGALPDRKANNTHKKAIAAKSTGDENDNDKKNEDQEEEELFSVGPLDFEAYKGEIIFIVGGNGSGKTTLGKMLTGLYPLDEGSIKINGKEIPNYQLGEYFSAIFNDYYLFKKLYEIDCSREEIMERAQRFLETIQLADRVEIKDNEFSTVDVSGGQKKRLALMQCYMENSPIYLFDEVAADQDPQFRRFFYRELLPQMKEEGKIVIAITHDDHYFDVADRLVKLDMGQIELVEDRQTFKVTN